ncbi:MAG: 2,3-bisphosphoglycerate-independent phosphoglycerate mutase [Bryobacterales bacterium]|nr:2,3-bisphosphoglycerate-independent phosphoglycerate mutase [Bryobacterales bacterium]MBV9399656.1 2,3-bisphosphoglycerate-independent phosphoglycerate mutase [Bryobacterales bacterium]
MMGRPLVLSILDGWGFSPLAEGNAITAADKPNYDKLLAEYPNTLVYTSGPYVGLPEGQMGNSEVGHLNIGAGRIIYMDVTRIDRMIASGEFFRNPVLLASMHHARTRRLHLMGLLSDGGVHSMNTHLYALLEMAKREGVADVCVHCFTDGRDTPPESGTGYIEALQKEIRRIGVGRIATISGRYYAMDRDKRWERIDRAKSAMTEGLGEKNTDPVAAVKRSYERGVTDEFIDPVTIVDARHDPVGLIRAADACLFFNYRADRARQMTQALVESPLKLHFTTMTQYDKTFTVPFVLPREHPNNILANVMAAEQWKNLRVAETEKYAHVTYFFNGGNEKPYPGEERELVPSPKVATYDLKPEMSAEGITDVVVTAIDKRDFDVIVMNFANADMVGHSGQFGPTVRAVETVDTCLGRIYDVLRRSGGRWIITADHGNAETMIDPVTKGPHTYHTTNPVPFIVVDEDQRALRPGGALQDIAPTVLGMLHVAQPNEMTGRDLRV